jgi:hypothetical protein
MLFSDLAKRIKSAVSEQNSQVFDRVVDAAVEDVLAAHVRTVQKARQEVSRLNGAMMKARRAKVTGYAPTGEAIEMLTVEQHDEQRRIEAAIDSLESGLVAAFQLANYEPLAVALTKAEKVARKGEGDKAS